MFQSCTANVTTTGFTKIISLVILRLYLTFPEKLMKRVQCSVELKFDWELLALDRRENADDYEFRVAPSKFGNTFQILVPLSCNAFGQRDRTIMNVISFFLIYWVFYVIKVVWYTVTGLKTLHSTKLTVPKFSRHYISRKRQIQAPPPKSLWRSGF